MSFKFFLLNIQRYSPFVGISDGIFLTGFFTAVLSSVSLSVLPEMCFDLRFRRCDLRLGFASFALSESLSLLDEVDVDEPVEVDEADEAAVFFGSGLVFSGATLGFGGALPGSGYFLGRPRPRPDAAELPEGRRISLIGGGLSSSDSDELEKILLDSFFDEDGAGFLCAAIVFDGAIFV